MKRRSTRTIRLEIRVVSRDFLARDVALEATTRMAVRVARTAFADAGFSIWSSDINTVDEGDVDMDAVPEVARHV